MSIACCGCCCCCTPPNRGRRSASSYCPAEYLAELRRADGDGVLDLQQLRAQEAVPAAAARGAGVRDVTHPPPHHAVRLAYSGIRTVHDTCIAEGSTCLAHQFLCACRCMKNVLSASRRSTTERFPGQRLQALLAPSRRKRC